MNKLDAKSSALAFLCGSLLNQVFVSIVFIFVSFFCALFGFKFSLEALQANCWGFLAIMAVMNFGLFLVFLIFKRKKEITFFKKPKLNKILIYILITIVGYYLICPFVENFNKFLLTSNINSYPFHYELTLKNYLITIIPLAIFPAVFEELLFRGIIFSGLKQYGKIFSIVISSIMFTLFHLSIVQTIFPFFMGLILGGIMHKEDNILYPIIAHLTGNFLTLTLSYFNTTLKYYFFPFLFIVLLIIFLTFALIYAIKGNSILYKQKLSKSEILYLTISIVIVFVFWIINSISILK